MEKNVLILKGDLCYSSVLGEWDTIEQGYLVCKDGVIIGVYSKLPKRWNGCPVTDYGHALLIPGLVDLHMHAPQYTYRGLHMDLELLKWLEVNTFPAEAKYADLTYAKEAYRRFVNRMLASGTTRACVFASIHVPATEVLMDLLEKSGLCTMVGKVNMDRNAPVYYQEENARKSARSTREWLEHCRNRYSNTQPILTPRFIPACSNELLEELQLIQEEYGIPVQSHLSENVEEIQWVKELCPEAEFYGDAYDRFGLFGRQAKTVMAHCVHSGEQELERIRENGVFLAHCPESNMNLSSGIAPVRRFLEMGIRTGLGSDVAGGASESIFTAMMHAIQASKLRWRLLEDSLRPLTASEVFYLATKGGGAFFGKVGSFEPGYELDVLVLDDSRIPAQEGLSIEQRMERFIYLHQEQDLVAKYVRGRKVYPSNKP